MAAPCFLLGERGMAAQPPTGQDAQPPTGKDAGTAMASPYTEQQGGTVAVMGQRWGRRQWDKMRGRRWHRRTRNSCHWGWMGGAEVLMRC